MTGLQTLWFILLTGIAVSYGWGMRGLLIGGEKGAMLPGALLGLMLAKFSGIPVLADHAVLFSAVGAMGTAFGGFEPYAHTADFMLHRDAPYYDPSLAYKGILLKGANWFGLSGVFLGIGFSAMTGNVYKWYDFVLFFALEPFIQALGVKLFNKPFDPQNGVFPKRYFSRTSREEWGGNSLMLLVLLLWTLVRRDWFAFLFGVVGMVTGSVGWLAAYKLDDYTAHRKKNGKYPLGKLQEMGVIDNWKIMEFGYGMIAGLCFAGYVCLQRNHLLALASQMENGIWNPLGKYGDMAAWMAFALILLTAVQYIFVFRAQKQGKKPDMHIFELLERPAYFVIPFALVMLGSETMAELICFPVLMWVAVEENLFGRLEDMPQKKWLKPLYLLLFVGAMVAAVLLRGAFPLWAKALLYTVFYLLCDLPYVLFHPKTKAERGRMLRGVSTVYGCFVVQSAILIAILCK